MILKCSKMENLKKKKTILFWKAPHVASTGHSWSHEKLDYSMLNLAFSFCKQSISALLCSYGCGFLTQPDLNLKRSFCTQSRAVLLLFDELAVCFSEKTFVKILGSFITYCLLEDSINYIIFKVQEKNEGSACLIHYGFWGDFRVILLYELE